MSALTFTPHSTPFLDVSGVRAALRARPEPVAIRIVPSTGSTNADVLEAARAGSVERCVLLAETQTAGRGRQGRSWVTLPGSALAFTLGLLVPRPPHALAGLALAAGVAVQQALAHLGIEAGLKWPNDIVAGAAVCPDPMVKLGGLLLETHPCAAGCYVVAGLGLNLRGAAELVGVLQRTVTDVAALSALSGRVAPADERIAAALIDALIDAFERFAVQGFLPFHTGFDRCDVLRGHTVEVTDGLGGQLTGVAEGVDQDGVLLVRTEQGAQRVFSGEVCLRMKRSESDPA